MEEMAKRPYPHLQIQWNRHGNVAYYVRMERHGKRIRIRGEFDSEEWKAAYYDAVAGVERPKRRKAKSGSISWLIQTYMATSSTWAALSKATRRQRENIFENVEKKCGTEPFADINQQHIVAGREERKDTPAQARNYLDAMRGLFAWAFEVKHVETNPTLGVKNPPRTKGPGFAVWTETDVENYERRWPVGTKERVWFDVLCYTGLRRGDAAEVGWQHVRDGVITLKTEKSGQTIEVTIPILPALMETLKAGPTGDMVFIVGANGRPLTKESFGNYFRDACNAAGVGKSAHGIRKIVATRAANNGATVAELEALFGWTGGNMAALYTRAADRRRLAHGAISKLAGERAQNASAPHPNSDAPHPGKSESEIKPLREAKA